MRGAPDLVTRRGAAARGFAQDFEQPFELAAENLGIVNPSESSPRDVAKTAEAG